MSSPPSFCHAALWTLARQFLTWAKTKTFPDSAAPVTIHILSHASLPASRDLYSNDNLSDDVLLYEVKLTIRPCHNMRSQIFQIILAHKVCKHEIDPMRTDIVDGPAFCTREWLLAGPMLEDHFCITAMGQKVCPH